MNRSDVVIIGAGAVGLSAAHFLSSQGARVTVLEQGKVGDGSSEHNAGLAVPSHFVPLASPGIIAKGFRWMLNPDSPFYIKPRFDPELLRWFLLFRKNCTEEHVRRTAPLLRDMHLESVELYRRFAEMPGLQFEFKEHGLLMLFNSEKGRADNVAMAGEGQRLGLDVRVLDNAQVNALDPGIRSHALGGVFFAQDTHLTPALFLRSLAARLRNGGVELIENAENLDFERANGRVASVRCTTGRYAATDFVIAAGAWSPLLSRRLGITIPLQAAKGYSITMPDPPRRISIPLILTESKVAVTPMGETLRLAGTLELAGVDLSINPRRVRAIVNALPRYLDDFDPARVDVSRPWAGLRPCTPDGLPFLGRSRTVGNVVLAAGHAMMGMSLAPVSGRMVAEIVQGASPSFDLRPFAVERFG